MASPCIIDLPVGDDEVPYSYPEWTPTVSYVVRQLIGIGIYWFAMVFVSFNGLLIDDYDTSK
jgi:hypothetical protein